LGALKKDAGTAVGEKDRSTDGTAAGTKYICGGGGGGGGDGDGDGGGGVEDAYICICLE
jgi:hypothetical protein